MLSVKSMPYTVYGQRKMLYVIFHRSEHSPIILEDTFVDRKVAILEIWFIKVGALIVHRVEVVRRSEVEANRLPALHFDGVKPSGVFDRSIEIAVGPSVVQMADLGPLRFIGLDGPKVAPVQKELNLCIGLLVLCIVSQNVQIGYFDVIFSPNVEH